MGGLRTESSALILGFTPRPSNAVLPLPDYESHAIGSLPSSACRDAACPVSGDDGKPCLYGKSDPI